MADIVRDVHQEFWRPPLSQPEPAAHLAEACRRCGTEFMVGAAFCHICGSTRHHTSASTPRNWTRYFSFVRSIDFSAVRNWFGLPLPSLSAFIVGVVFLIIAASMGFVDTRDSTLDFEAVQFFRMQWLVAACAAFLVGILFKNQKSPN